MTGSSLKQMPMADAGTKPSPADRHSLRDILGEALFYLGIPAIMLYLLGFIALCLQLWRDPDFPYDWPSSGLDFAMLWYAASLVPKVVVIRTGVRLMFISLLSTIMSMSIASLTLHFLREWNLVKDRVKHGEQGVSTGGWESLNKWERRFSRLSLVTLLPIAVLLIWENFPFDSWYDLPFYAGYFVFSAAGGVVLGYVRFWRHDRWLHHGLSLAFAGSILAALSLSALELPDLPFCSPTRRRPGPRVCPVARLDCCVMTRVTGSSTTAKAVSWP